MKQSNVYMYICNINNNNKHIYIIMISRVMYTCIYVHMYKCIYVYTYKCIYVYMYICNVYMYI